MNLNDNSIVHLVLVIFGFSTKNMEIFEIQRESCSSNGRRTSFSPRNSVSRNSRNIFDLFTKTEFLTGLFFPLALIFVGFLFWYLKYKILVSNGDYSEDDVLDLVFDK